MRIKNLFISILAIGTCLASAVSVNGALMTNVEAASKKKTKLNKKDVYLKPKKSYTLKLLNNKKKIRWTSGNKKIAKVSSKGVVKALRIGSTTIRAKAGSKVYNASVQVSEISLEPDTYIFVNKKKTLHLKGTMAKPSWSTDNAAIASVDADGTVKGVKVGTASVTANYKGKNYTTNLHVVKMPKLSKKSLTLNTGLKYTLKVKNNTAKLPIRWTSSNKKVATVTASGKVTSKKKTGKATIKATINGLALSCKVTVKKKIYITQGKQMMVPTETKKYTVSNASGKKVKWSSSQKKVATISSKGTVTAKKAGTTTITATISKKKYKAKLTVKKPKIAIGSAPYRVGYKYNMTFSNISYKADWSTSNKSIAKITKAGVLTPLKEGNVIVKAKVKKYVAQAQISIINKYTIKFYENGAAITLSKPNDIVAYSSDPVTLPADNGYYFKPGYNLTSWNTSPDGTGASYDLGGTYSNLQASGTLKLYAQYTLKDYAVKPAGEEYRAFDLADIDANSGNYKQSTSVLASISDINASQTMYFSIDDFVNYQIAYAQYDSDGSIVMKSGWKSSGQILEGGYNYRLLIRKVSKDNISTDDISSIGNLVRYEADTVNTNVSQRESQVSYVAHRGYHSGDKIPDNSIPAFEQAVKRTNVSGIETDVYNTADNELVINHNKNYSKIIKGLSSTDDLATKNISDINSSELAGKTLMDGSKVPTLQDYINIIKNYNDSHPYNHKHAFIEIKKFTDPACYTKLVKMITDAGLQKDTTIISFNIGYLENIRNTVPESADISIMGLYSKQITDDDVNLMAHFANSGIDQSISALKMDTADHINDTNNQIYTAISKGLNYGIWTIKNKSSDLTLAHQLMNLGVNYVTYDCDNIDPNSDGDDIVLQNLRSSGTSSGSGAEKQGSGLSNDNKTDKQQSDQANEVVSD